MQKNIIRIDDENSNIWENMTEECYVLNVALDDSFCQKFIAKAAQNEQIVLFYGEGAVSSAKKYAADGVVLDLGSDDVKEKLKTIRKELSPKSIVGLFTRNRRHESMLVSEAEPDFIVFKVWKDGFENIKELTNWYADFFLIQSAAWEMEDFGGEINDLRTDFIIKK